MAVQGSIRKAHGLEGRLLVLWSGVLLALGLSLAAALGGLLLDGDASAPAASAAEEAAAREQRIAFFEARAAADPIDFLSLNNLAAEYLQRARETGDVADYAARRAGRQPNASRSSPSTTTPASPSWRRCASCSTTSPPSRTWPSGHCP